MTGAPVPENEADRLRALASYGLHDSMHDAALDSLVRAASMVCDVPISLISLVEEHRQWFPSSLGLPGASETPRDLAFCAHAILSSEVMVVDDAAQDPRFASNPLVLTDPHIRFYVGAPLVDKEGFALGTLCVIDRKPRTLSPHQIAILRELASAVVRLLEARRIDHALFEAEQAARVARADLDMVLDAVSARVASWDSALVNRFSNAAFAGQLGIPREEIRGRHFDDVVGEGLAARAAPFLERTLRGEPQRFQHEVRGENGAIEHLDVSLTPDVQDGVVVGFVSTSMDVTALKAALVSSEQQNELLVLAEELSEVGHWRLDLRTEVLFWSPQVYRIHGRDPATFAPTLANAIDAYHPDDRARVAELVGSAAARGEPFAFELRLVRPDGTLRQVESRGRCEVDHATNATLAIFGVFNDVTERNRVRDLVAHRSRLVTTGTLAAGVGHEINNPLTYVTANLEFAVDEVRSLAGGSPSRRMLELTDALVEAHEGAERIRKIVRGLRAFGRADHPLGPTDVGATLEVSATMAGATLRGCATVNLQHGAIPHVLADESRLSQVFVNVLVNAAQAFEVRDPERNRIDVRSSLLPDGRVAVEIQDNGPGIPRDVLPRIFDPFFTTKSVGSGSGLGLAISHTLVTAFGGELTCTTKCGEGTTFRVVLLPSGPPAVEAVEDEPRATGAATPRGRVLLVDDEPAICRTIERALREEHEVVWTRDPREALRLLLAADAAFDVVFCDITMPHLTGVDLYEQVNAHDSQLAERFVFICGGAMNEEVRVFLDRVPNERLEKPIRNQSLRGAARRVAMRPK